MRFNYGDERRKLDKAWKELRCEYLSAGVSEDIIDEVYKLDREWLNSERSYLTHTVSFEGSFKPDSDMTEESQSPLMKDNLHSLSVTHEICSWGRYEWIEDLDNPDLALEIKSLTLEDIEFLTYLIVDKLSCAEISRELNISRAAVSKRMKRIRKILHKFLPQG